jgi:hypothetical protein
VLVERPLEIGSFTANLDVGLIDPPTRRLRATPLPAQSLFDLRRVLLTPTIDRGVINAHAVFAHHLFEITVAYPVAAVPTHGPKNDLAFKMTPLELSHDQLCSRSAHSHRDTETLQQSPWSYFS